MANKRAKLRAAQTSLSAIEAAKNLDPAELQKILDGKKPASPEELDKSVIDALLAEAEKLPNEELSKFVARQEKALKQLNVLHIKRGVTALNLNQQELDGLLMVLDKLPAQTKTDLTTRIQQAAVAAGLNAGQPLQVFAQKLTRMGLHL